MPNLVMFASVPQTFGRRSNDELTWPFPAKLTFSLPFAFESVLLAFTFLIGSERHTFFGSALAGRFHRPSIHSLRHGQDFKKNAKQKGVRCSMLSVT